MAKIVVNTNEGKQHLAQQKLKPSRIDNLIIQLNDFLALDTPTAAEKLSQQRLQARILKRILNSMRRQING